MYETISYGEDYQVDYDRENGRYRFSLIKDYHFAKEWIFDEADSNPSKEARSGKKRLLGMYEDAINDATSMWISEFCCGDEYRKDRLERDKIKMEIFKNTLRGV